MYVHRNGTKYKIAVIAAHNTRSIGLTFTKVAIAITCAANAIASATTEE